jgi:hypothetical protein
MIDHVIANDLHGLVLAHQKAVLPSLAVLQDLGVADSTLEPLLLSSALVQEGFLELEELGTDAVDHFLFLLSSLNINFFQLDLQKQKDK